MADGEEYPPPPDLDGCECPCGADMFEITAGVALYHRSNDVRWLYLGLRCVRCGLVACFGDWSCEYPDYQKLLMRI